jgi:hypothetical protein
LKIEEKKMSKTFRINERAFLNVFSNLRAYVIAYVEDTNPYPACCEEYREGGEISLRIADCYKEIDLYFDLSTARERENSLHKAQKLADIITRFRDAIEAEAKAIEGRETIQQHTRAAAAVH